MKYKQSFKNTADTVQFTLPNYYGLPKKINIIIEKNESAGRDDLAEEVSILSDSSFTSSNLLLSVTHSLNGFMTNDNVIKGAIESDIIELREYCWSIGLAVQ